MVDVELIVCLGYGIHNIDYVKFCICCDIILPIGILAKNKDDNECKFTVDLGYINLIKLLINLYFIEQLELNTNANGHCLLARSVRE